MVFGRASKYPKERSLLSRRSLTSHCSDVVPGLVAQTVTEVHYKIFALVYVTIVLVELRLIPVMPQSVRTVYEHVRPFYTRLPLWLYVIYIYGYMLHNSGARIFLFR